MASRPPQESPRRPNGGRKPNGTGGTPTPPWLWFLLIVGFGLIFWQFTPKNETTVSYSPWFLDQVDSGNVKSLTMQGLEVHGELRQEKKYQPATSAPVQTVKKFTTNFPSEQAIQPVMEKLRAVSEASKAEPVRIGPGPAQRAATSLVWITLLLPTFVILGL